MVEEGKDLLPPKYGSRTNLVNCFHALLLAVLIEEGVFEVTVQVSNTLCLSIERIIIYYFDSHHVLQYFFR